MLEDAKMLIWLIVSLLGIVVLERVILLQTDLWNILRFFLAMLTLMILMHYFGLIEGREMGFSEGLKKGYDEAMNGSY